MNEETMDKECPPEVLCESAEGLSLAAQSVFVVVPTYNELPNLQRLLDQLLSLPQRVELVVVDDNSPDGTGPLADNISRAEPRVHVIHRPAKLGLGTAYIAGFKYALANKADLVVTLDADLSHDPGHIPVLLRGARDFDVVIGSRYAPGGAAVNSPLYRLLFSRGANFFAKSMLGLKASDCTSGYRCYRASVLAAIEYDGIFSKGYSFLIEFLCRLQQAGFTIAESPILFSGRQSGESKVSNREIFGALSMVFRLAFDGN